MGLGSIGICRNGGRIGREKDIYPFFFGCVFFPTYPTSVSTDTNRSKGQEPKPTYLPWFFGTYARFFSDVSFSLPILPPFLQIPIDPRDRIPNLPTMVFRDIYPVFFGFVFFPTYPTSVSTDTNRSKGKDPKPPYLPLFFGTYTRFFL